MSTKLLNLIIGIAGTKAKVWQDISNELSAHGFITAAAIRLRVKLNRYDIGSKLGIKPVSLSEKYVLESNFMCEGNIIIIYILFL